MAGNSVCSPSAQDFPVSGLRSNSPNTEFTCSLAATVISNSSCCYIKSPVPSFLQRCGRAIAGVLREDENPRVLTGDVTSIGAKAHAVTMADGAGCEGRILLISTGAKMNFSGTQGADEFSSPRYSVHDVLLPSS